MSEEFASTQAADASAGVQTCVPRYVSTLQDIRDALAVLGSVTAGDRIYETRSGHLYTGGKGIGLYHLVYHSEGRAKTMERVEQVVTAAREHWEDLSAAELQRAAEGVRRLEESFQVGSNVAETLGRVYLAEASLLEIARQSLNKRTDDEDRKDVDHEAKTGAENQDQKKILNDCTMNRQVVDTTEAFMVAPTETDKSTSRDSESVGQSADKPIEDDASCTGKEIDEADDEEDQNDESTPLLDHAHEKTSGRDASLCMCRCDPITFPFNQGGPNVRGNGADANGCYAANQKKTISPPKIVDLPADDANPLPHGTICQSNSLHLISKVYTDENQNTSYYTEPTLRHRKRTRRGKRKKGM